MIDFFVELFEFPGYDVNFLLLVWSQFSCKLEAVDFLLEPETGGSTPCIEIELAGTDAIRSKVSPILNFEYLHHNLVLFRGKCILYSYLHQCGRHV